MLLFRGFGRRELDLESPKASLFSVQYTSIGRGGFLVEIPRLRDAGQVSQQEKDQLVYKRRSTVSLEVFIKCHYSIGSELARPSIVVWYPEVTVT